MLFLLTVVRRRAEMGPRPGRAGGVRQRRRVRFLLRAAALSFAVSDFQYLLTFAVMLVVALIIGQMTAGLRYQARIASYREERARTLYEFARDMSSLLLTEDVVDAATKSIANTFRAKVAILVADAERPHFRCPRRATAGPRVDGRRAVGVRQVAARRHGTDTLAGNAIPVPAAARADAHARRARDRAATIRGCCWCPSSGGISTRSPRLTAIALERVHYVEVAQQALLHMESERLRNSLLSALSHDLRTPLAALVGPRRDR